MDKGATKEPVTSTPAWDELEEWTRGRIQGVDAAVVGRGGERVPGAQEVPAPGSRDGRLSERLRQAAAADDAEWDRDATPATGERSWRNGSRADCCRCSRDAPRR